MTRDGVAMNMLYHTVPGKPLDIEEYSAYSYVSVYSRLIEGEKVNVNLLKFPTAIDYEREGSTSSMSTVIHYTEEETKKFKDPVALVTVVKSSLSMINTNTSGFYNVNYWFSLQLTHELTFLEKNISKHGFVGKSQWKFYTFYNDNTKDIPILIDVEPLDNGDPDLYIVQGKNNRPTLSKYLMKSNQFKGDHLVITKKDLDKIGLKKMNGYYVIGIYGFKETKFALKWKHSNSTVSVASFMRPLFLDLLENRSQYIELTHFMYKTPITIKMSASHSHVVLLINTVDKNAPGTVGYFESYPWLDNYQFRIDLKRTHTIIKKTIEIDDKHFCDSCKYLMTIFTADPGVRVELLATYKTTFSHINLESGKQLIDYLDPKEEEKYKIENVDPKLVPDIDVNMMQGKMEFYSGHNVLLSTENYTWKLDIDEGRNFIKLSNKSVPDGPNMSGFLLPPKAVSPAAGGPKKPVMDFVSNFMNHLFADTYLIAKCISETACHYKIQSKLPDELNEIHPGMAKKSTVGKGETDYYIFEAKGNEDKVEVFFKILGYAKSDLKKDQFGNFSYADNYKALNQLHVYHTTNKEDLDTKKFGFEIQANTFSYLHGNSMVRTYQPRKGFFTVEIQNTLDKDFHYSIELLTNAFRMVDFGEMYYDYVNTKFDTKYFEIHVDSPGYVYIDINTCLSDINLYYMLGSEDKYKFKPTNDKKFDQTVYVEKAGPVFFKVVKDYDEGDLDPATEVERNQGYIPTSVFSLEFYYQRHYSNYPFKGVYPGNGSKVDFELGAHPQVSFDPVVIREDLLKEYTYHMIYHLVMSPSEKEVKFRSGCDRLFEFYMPKAYRDNVIELTKDVSSLMDGMYTVGKLDDDENHYTMRTDDDDEKALENLEKKAQRKQELSGKVKRTPTADDGKRILLEKTAPSNKKTPTAAKENKQKEESQNLVLKLLTPIVPTK